MTEAIAPAPPAEGGTWARTLALVDTPARQAFLLARRPWAATGILLAGTTVSVGLCLGAAALVPDPVARAATYALMTSAAYSLLTVLPSAVVFGAYARLAVSPRAWWGALACAAVTCAVVLSSGAPLLVYLTLVARAAPMLAPALLLAAVALVAVGGTLGRVLRVADPGIRGAWAARGLALSLGAAFVAQATLHPDVQAVLPSLGWAR